MAGMLLIFTPEEKGDDLYLMERRKASKFPEPLNLKNWSEFGKL